MSSDAMIRVEGLGKQFQIGARRQQYYTFRDRLVEAVTSPFRRRSEQNASYVWALRDVSFTVAPGEVVGLIGANGAGKSTLLKILTRIVDPTVGRAELYGRVGSLLEVGTGFHGELTGRENIFLNGAILGMRRREIEKRFDEIVHFAEIDTFLDSPVKHYSSGMYMRLAFAVAVHMDPQILLVDEVLAVGDTAFQQKGLRRMRSFASDGRTVFFVSHNFEAVRTLCTRCLVLEKGRIVFDGTPEAAIQIALDRFRGKGSTQFTLHAIRKGVDVAQPEAVSVRAAGKAVDDAITFDDEIVATLRLSAPVEQDHTFAFHVTTPFGVIIFNSFHRDDPSNPPLQPGRTREVSVRIPAHLLPDGVYEAVFLHMLPNADLFWVARDIIFEVHDQTSDRNAGLTSRRSGLVSMVLRWEAD